MVSRGTGKNDETLAPLREPPSPPEERRRSAGIAAGHIRRLQAFTAALSEAATVEQIGAALLSQGIKALGASAGSLSVMEGEDGLKIVEAVGYPEQLVSRWRHIPMALQTPLTDSLRTGEPVWLEAGDWEKHYPALVPDRKIRLAAAALPLSSKGKRLGAIGLTFTDFRNFTEDDKAFFVALAQSCAHSIERVYLGEEEKQARELAKEATDRLELLSEFSRALAEAPVERATAFRNAVRLLGERFGQSSSLLLLSDDGTALETVARYHESPEAEALMERLSAGQALPVSQGIMGRVAHSGAPVLMTDATLEGLLEETLPVYRPYLKQFPVYSLMVVPLFVQGSVGGTMHVARHKPGAPYSLEDLAVLEELAERVGLLVSKTQLLEETRAAVRLRDDFLSIASHELKTPLTSLRLQQELLQRGLETESKEKLRGRIDATLRQVSRLSALVESLLDVSRISAGTLKLEPAYLDFPQAVRDTLERLELVFDGAGCVADLEIGSDGPIEGYWDPLRLDQIFVNLLSNAAKYGAGKPVHLKIQAGNGRVLLEVRDEGIGIPAEALPRLFGRFERAVSERHYGGLGLGLYITRQITIAMGGNVKVECPPDGGARFKVDLPWNRTQASSGSTG